MVGSIENRTNNLMSHQDYWEETISEAAISCGLNLSEEHVKTLGVAVSISHDNYGLAYYSPPASDRVHAEEREWKVKYDALKREFDDYRNNAETAIKRALRQHSDAQVGIGKYGEVTRYDGRSTRIQ